MPIETRDELKKRLRVTSDFIGRDNHQYWMTASYHLINPSLAGAPVPDILVQLIRLTKTPLDMIYRMQQGLGVYDMDGNYIPIGIDGTRPKPKGYQLFNDALAWLGSNYPDVGGWFYSVEIIHKANKQ